MGEKGLAIAIEEAKKGYEEGGVPIGGALISEDGTVFGRGHNLRFQKDSATLHGEISTLENAGRLKGSVYKNCTMYTTLSPCSIAPAPVLCTESSVWWWRERDFYGGRGLDSQ